MEKRSCRVGAPAFAAAAILLMLAALLVLPGKAFAADSVAYSQDDAGNKTYYSSTSDALSAGFSGKTIVMTADWDMADPIKIEKNKKLTIEMNGHVLRRTTFNTPWYSQYTDRHAAVFHLYENSELVLTGNLQSETEYTYEGYSTSDDRRTQTTVSGGFITSGTDTGTRYGGFWLEDNGGKVTLENVAAVGMNGMHPGFCIEGKNCTVNLKNAKIEHNKSTYEGGAITVYGKYATINMDASHMDYNASTKYGGALYSNAGGTTINMINSSTIDHNYSFSEGGALYFAESYFHVVSSDKTGSISNNGMWIEDDHEEGKDDYAHGGGAIATHTVVFGTNEASIEGITINKNRSNRRAAGLMLRSEYITVKDCTITNNIAKAVGGAAVVLNDHIVFDNCTITGNVSEMRGGGIVVESNFDVRLSGVTTITGNTSGASGTKDDLHLVSSPEDAFAAAAYTLGNVAPGSKIGLAFNSNFSRKVGTSMSDYVEGAYFLDDADGWHLSYNAADKELWRIQGEVDYALTINGKGANQYKMGSNVTVNGLSSDKSKVFMYWSSTGTTGLQPIESYIPNVYDPLVSFTMPANNVNLVALYGSRLTSTTLKVTTPVAGQKFPTTAELNWIDTAIGGIRKANIPLAWYEVTADGKEKAVSGKAKEGTAYVARAIAREGQTNVPVFDPSLSSKTVAQYVDGNQTGNVSSATLDAKTGTLTLTTTQIKTPGAQGEAGEEGTVTLNFVDNAILANDAAATASVAAADADGNAGEVSDRLVVTYRKGSSVTVVAPARNGMNFNHWEDVPADCVYDDEERTVTIADPDEDVELTAVYTPVVTEIDMGAAVPTKGAELASALGSLEVHASDGSSLDFVEEIAGKGATLPVMWSPEAEGGKAAAQTAYTAKVDLGSAEGLVDLDNALSPNVVIRSNGNLIDGAAAGLLVEGGKLYLCVTFPATDALKAVDVAPIDDVEFTFEAACGYQSEQEVYIDGENHWKLPRSTSVTLDDGTRIEAGITWDIPTEFDANALVAQQFTVTGSITLPSAVDAGSVSTDVSATVKVAAPEIGSKFPDVDYSANSWYAAGVTYCAQKGLVLGYEDGTFGVGDTMDRAQLATMLWRYSKPTAAQEYDAVMDQTAGSDAVDGIEDARFYTGAANWAVDKGVIEGFERADAKRNFAPYTGVTFEQLVCIIAKASGADYESCDLAELNRFADADQVSDWAAHAMAWAVNTSLVSGWDNGSDQMRELAPGELVSRERAAVVLANALKAGILD